MPHEYYEENILHGVLLSWMKDFDACLEQVEKFLPYVDNWAVCDGLNPGAFRKHREAVKARLPMWIASEAVCTWHCWRSLQRCAQRSIMST